MKTETIGIQQSFILTGLDIRDAFFSQKLKKESQKFADISISSYHGGRSYQFVRLCQGLSISPSVFSEYIIQVLSEIPNYQDCVVSYMDDLLIHSTTVEEHQEHIGQILRVRTKAKLKISPKKSLFFRNIWDM